MSTSEVFLFLRYTNVLIIIIMLHQMHDMQTIVTDDCGVCLSVHQYDGSVSLSVCHVAQLRVVHLMQPLTNHFGLFLIIIIIILLLLSFLLLLLL